MRNEKIVLVTRYKEGKDILENTCEIFAERKSVGRSEFYAGYSVGLKPQYVFDILPEEYFLAAVESTEKQFVPTHIRYKGIDYPIIRTYEKDSYSMLITVG